MPLTHNPQSIINGYTSQLRNVFLTSAVGFSAMAFSGNFKQYEKLVIIFALFIFMYSSIYGFKAAANFTQYINYLKQREKLEPPYNILVEHWGGWITMTYIYIALLVILSIIVILRKLL